MIYYLWITIKITMQQYLVMKYKIIPEDTIKNLIELLEQFRRYFQINLFRLGQAFDHPQANALSTLLFLSFF